MTAIFDPIANAYDGWYDTPEGSAIFREEVKCLRAFRCDYSGRWLEVGVGTGRFAKVLGVTHGIDFSVRMAEKAALRGVRVQVGRAEQLPFRRDSFDGVLMALSLCFLNNPEAAFLECARVLRDNGRLVLGTIPADSPWGRAYIKKGVEGHPAYSHARFHPLTETMRIAEKANFDFRQSISALFWKPGSSRPGPSRIEPGVHAAAGFVGLLFEVRTVGANARSINAE
jgi:ubiquinone/menaquinone biosynthesis C-methylase UbiE